MKNFSTRKKKKNSNLKL